MNEKKRVAIASDHAGFSYKEAIKEHLREAGHFVMDFGTDSAESVDYPLFIRAAAEAVSIGGADLGIVLGGSGNGEAIVANKIPGVRCGLCWNEESARLTKEHNDANVISIGERMVSKAMALRIVDAWLEAEFEGGRHARRVAQVDALL
jgi:ribose 5-phosphate isomerase B